VFSTSLPSQTVLDGLLGDLLDINGVGRTRLYENATSLTDANGVPSHSVAAVLEGGNVVKIAETILLRKTLGTGTFGSASQVVLDLSDIPRTIFFSRPEARPIEIRLTISPRTGYTSLVGDALKNALVEHVAKLDIGVPVSWSALFVPAKLGGSPEGLTYDITSLETRIPAAGWGVVPIPVSWNALPSCPLADITLTVT
jgi:hypothetical protein